MMYTHHYKNKRCHHMCVHSTFLDHSKQYKNVFIGQDSHLSLTGGERSQVCPKPPFAVTIPQHRVREPVCQLNASASEQSFPSSSPRLRVGSGEGIESSWTLSIVDSLACYRHAITMNSTRVALQVSDMLGECGQRLQFDHDVFVVSAVCPRMASDQYIHSPHWRQDSGGIRFTLVITK